jgi:catechol 2,3-dioxygenase-like lactoylglutathione lyase family enzyme
MPYSIVSIVSNVSINSFVSIVSINSRHLCSLTSSSPLFPGEQISHSLYHSLMLHHVELYVSCLKTSSEFWGWFLADLGYEKFQEWEDGVSWKFDSCYIVLVQTESRFQEIPYHRCRTGLNHLAFHAQSKLQVDQMTEKLRDRGIKILYQDLHPYAGGKDYYAVFFEDPDRMKLELVAP